MKRTVKRTVQRIEGFTLIELMIVVAVIAAIAAIALPNYMEYSNRAKRSVAQQILLDVAQRQEQFRLDNRNYSIIFGAGAGGLGLSAPASYPAHYATPSIVATNAAAGVPPVYTACATPVAGGVMASDGSLCINSQGARWRDFDTGCDASSCVYLAGTDKLWEDR